MVSPNFVPECAMRLSLLVVDECTVALRCVNPFWIPDMCGTMNLSVDAVQLVNWCPHISGIQNGLTQHKATVHSSTTSRDRRMAHSGTKLGDTK